MGRRVVRRQGGGTTDAGRPGASSTTRPPGRVTRSSSPRTARSQPSMPPCTPYRRCAYTSEEAAWLVLDHPQLDVGRIGDAPVRLLPPNRFGYLAAKIGAEEGSLLKDPGDHPERRPRPHGTAEPGTDGQRPPGALSSPEATRDPTRSVALCSQRPSDLDEDVLGEPSRHQALERRRLRGEEDDVRAAVEPLTLDEHAGNGGELAGQQRREPGHREREEPGSLIGRAGRWRSPG
jgi:hypothetical protein